MTSHPADLAWPQADILVSAEDAGVSLALQITMSAREHESHIVIEPWDSVGKYFCRGRVLIVNLCYSTKLEHYGLVLYISSVLIEHNGGRFVLERDVEGACVVTTLPSAGS